MVNQLDHRMLSLNISKPQQAKMPLQAKTAAESMTPEQKKLSKSCTDFEAMMVQKMFEVMQGSTKMFGSGFGGDFFQSMFQEEIAKQVASNGNGMGIAKMMYQHLSETTK